MNKKRVLESVIKKHGGVRVHEEGKNFWVNGNEKVEITLAFLLQKLKEPVSEAIQNTDTDTTKKVIKKNKGIKTKRLELS